MPIKSYLTHPTPGMRDDVVARLSSLPGCEVFPSTTHDVVILLTDTGSTEEERELEQALAHVAGIQCLSFISGAEPDLIQIESGPEVRQ